MERKNLRLPAGVFILLFFAGLGASGQVKAIRQGALPVMKVGNLDNRRDFTDVRDVARAYRLLLEKGIPGRAYNITSGRESRIGDILDLLCKLAGVKPELRAMFLGEVKKPFRVTSERDYDTIRSYLKLLGHR